MPLKSPQLPASEVLITHNHIHSPVLLLINNDPKQSFYSDECWIKVSLHAESLDRKKVRKAPFDPFPTACTTSRGKHTWVGLMLGSSLGCDKGVYVPSLMTSCKFTPLLHAIPWPCECLLDGEVMMVCRSMSWGGNTKYRVRVGGMLVMHTKYTIYYICFPRHHLFAHCTYSEHLQCVH